ncbi:MAG: heparan-alpha-glucosaminide N-acetyltransferase domain-containing protein [Promethearchaeota archaeon]
MSLLEDYIKELNRLETAKRSKSFTRILSIDFVKGLAICLIILAHTGEAWISPEWRYAYAILFLCLDVFGPSLFIFLSALSVVFSMKKKSELIPEKVIRNSIYIRGITIIALGLIFNVATNREAPFPYNMWGWNILMFIGFAQIITYYAVKFSRGSRILIGTMIIFLTPQIREYLYLNKDTNPIIGLLHFIIISPAPHNPFIPYVALCFFSSIFGELFFEAMLLETREAYIDAFKSFIKYGCFFVLAGLFLAALGGWVATPDLFDPDEYRFMYLLDDVNNQPYYEINGILIFLVRGTAANLCYSLGMALLILGFFFYVIDIRGVDKEFENTIMNMFIFLGRVSLSLFFIHYIGLFFFYRQLNIAFFFPIWLACIGFLCILIYIWNKWADGKFTFEWIMANMMGNKRKKNPPTSEIG